jgi:hypothetical protein
MSNATVAGGMTNKATNTYAAVGGGKTNSASGPYSTIPGGGDNIATTAYTFAAGRQAKAISSGSFVWADNRGFDLYSLSPNSFNARATGGFRFITGIDSAGHETTGVTLNAGSGSWSDLSDRNAKTNFAAIDTAGILRLVVGLPVQSWSYRTEDSAVRHIGPVAQDFAAAFGIGADDRHISTVDADGVALAAIQGLDQKVEEKDQQITAQQEQIAALTRDMATLKQEQRNCSTASSAPATITLDWRVALLAGGLLLVLLILSSVSLTLVVLRRRTATA